MSIYLVPSLGCDTPNLFSDIKELPFRLALIVLPLNSLSNKDSIVAS